MSKDHIRLQSVHQQLYITDAVFGNVVNQFMHLIRILIKVGQGIFKAHQEVELFEDAGTHEPGNQPVISGLFPGIADIFIPAVLTVGSDIRRMDIVPPVRDILEHLQFLGCNRHRSGRVRREIDGRAPAVLGDSAADPAAPEETVDRVPQRHVKGFVLFQLAFGLAVGFQQFKK